MSLMERSAMETSAAASDAMSASGSPRLSLSVTSPSWLMGDPGCISGSGASMKSTSGYCASMRSCSTSTNHARDICAGNQSSPRRAQPLAQYNHTIRTDVAALPQRFSVRQVAIRVLTRTLSIILSQERLRRIKRRYIASSRARWSVSTSHADIMSSRGRLFAGAKHARSRRPSVCDRGIWI